MDRTSVLIVEDDPDVSRLVRLILERVGMRVIEAISGGDGLHSFYTHRPELVVLDIRLPDLDGWQLLERIREVSDVGVMILSGCTTEMDKVRALRAGADDYLTKPFGHQELVARVEALLRRGGGGADDLGAERCNDGLIGLDFRQRRATVLGWELSLTPTEFRLLSVLVRNPGQVLGHDRLLEMVWSDTLDCSRNRVKLYVGYLRRKLQGVAAVDPIETVRGFGYRYNPTARE